MIRTKCIKIDREFAKQFIPLDEDYSGITVDECPYFTFTKGDDGWDYPKYYTYRKRSQFVNRSQKYNSWVYILSNPSMPGLLKIGYTDRDSPEERVKEISSGTGVPEPFKLEYAFNCYDGKNLEYEVHSRLMDKRYTRNKEFFDVELSEAQDIIINLGKNYL